MSQSKPRSPQAYEAARLLGARVQLGRRERGWTIVERVRVGVSEATITKVERGDPSVALGTALEAATLVGVVLFHPDEDRRQVEAARVADRLALLPAAVRHRASPDDDF